MRSKYSRGDKVIFVEAFNRQTEQYVGQVATVMMDRSGLVGIKFSDGEIFYPVAKRVKPYLAANNREAALLLRRG